MCIWLFCFGENGRYILMAEPDHIFVKPLPNLALDNDPAAFPFFYITPSKHEKIIRKYYAKERGPVTDIDPIGNSPVIVKKVISCCTLDTLYLCVLLILWPSIWCISIHSLYFTCLLFRFTNFMIPHLTQSLFMWELSRHFLRRLPPHGWMCQFKWKRMKKQIKFLDGCWKCKNYLILYANCASSYVHLLCYYDSSLFLWPLGMHTLLLAHCMGFSISFVEISWSRCSICLHFYLDSIPHFK